MPDAILKLDTNTGRVAMLQAMHPRRRLLTLACSSDGSTVATSGEVVPDESAGQVRNLLHHSDGALSQELSYEGPAHHADSSAPRLQARSIPGKASSTAAAMRSAEADVGSSDVLQNSLTAAPARSKRGKNTSAQKWQRQKYQASAVGRAPLELWSVSAFKAVAQ